MLLLTSSSDFLELQTLSPVSTDWTAGYLDINGTTGTFVPGSAQGNVVAAGTISIVGSPPDSNTRRQLKYLSVVNKDPSLTQTVVIDKNSGAAFNLTGPIALSPGDSLQYVDSRGFSVLTSQGQEKFVGLPGPQGPMGPAGVTMFLEGDAGDDGVQGPPGGAGAAGTPGPTGPAGQGAPGLDGEPGEDAMHIPGPAGPVGATGGLGPMGPAVYLDADAGEEGAPGSPGATGPIGPPGSTGAQGPVGPAAYLEADAGEEGAAGAPGAQGPAGATGSAGPVGPAVFLDADVGETGDIGPPGTVGLQGPAGATGAPGPSGYIALTDADAGDEGAPGVPGAAGAPGSAGSTGAQGPVGPAVFLDADVLEGEPGAPGSPGATGAAGAPGPPGPSGILMLVDDTPGDDGLPGPPGAQGPQGAAGAPGASGGAGFGILYQEITLEDQWPQGVPGSLGPTTIMGLTTIGDSVGRGLAIVKRATAIETRTSTIVLSNSTQLAAPLAPGTYAFELCVYLYSSTAGTDGLTANVNFSGSFTAVGSYYGGYALYTTPAFIQNAEVALAVTTANANLTTVLLGTNTAVPSALHLKGNLIATSAGTLAFAFAESVSGVDTANLGVGSWMRVTPLN